MSGLCRDCVGSVSGIRRYPLDPITPPAGGQKSSAGALSEACRSLVGNLVGALSDGLSGKLVRIACRSSIFVRFWDDLGPVLVGFGRDEQAMDMSNTPVGLVGFHVGLPCRIFWRQDTFLKDNSYESLVEELFLEESLVGSCRTRFLARVFFSCNIVLLKTTFVLHSGSIDNSI